MEQTNLLIAESFLKTEHQKFNAGRSSLTFFTYAERKYPF